MQNKIEEIKVHLAKLEKEGDNYRTSKWGRVKFNRALSFLYSFLEDKKYKVLEIGIGGATLTKHLLKNKNFDITGLDLVKEVLDKVTKKRVNISLVCGDIENLPFKNESFDIIIHNQTLHHFRKIDNALSEIYRVLKKNGFLFSIETNGWNPYVIYGHTAPWKKRKRFISCNQKVFSLLKFKKELRQNNFTIKDHKMINFGFNKFEKISQKFPVLNLIFAGSMVVCSQKL